MVIDLDHKVEIKQDRLQDPPRLFVDLIGTRLHPNLVGKTFPVGNAFLKQIRIGVNREDVVRVVIDFGEASSHSVFFLADPERLVIDVRGESPRGARVAETKPSASPTPGDRAIAVGTERRAFGDRRWAISRWDGNEWLTRLGPSGTDGALLSIAGTPPGHLWAVGFRDKDLRAERGRMIGQQRRRVFQWRELIRVIPRHRLIVRSQRSTGQRDG